jgi:2-oxoglutarate ferredoxin oxidoreductase subunit alpha
MTPVILLSDGYIANGAEPWRIPNVSELPEIQITHPSAETNGASFKPYLRDEVLARPWALPGTPGLMHRIGGLEKQDITGNISYDPENHQHMVKTRATKVRNVAEFVAEQAIEGAESGTLVVSWGGTYGTCHTAVMNCLADGIKVGHCHLRWLNPFPRNLGQILSRYERIIVAELNTGQLRMLLRSEFLVDAVGINKIKGKPFTVGEVVEGIKSFVKTGEPTSEVRMAGCS